MTQALTIMDENGPLPRFVGFRTSGKEQLFIVSGSFWSGNMNDTLEIFLVIDDIQIGKLELNQRHAVNEHVPITKHFVTLLAHGSHTLSLSLGATTLGGQNDTYCVSMLDIS